MLYYIISFCLINGYFKHLKEDDITEHIFGDDILCLCMKRQPGKKAELSTNY